MSIRSTITATPSRLATRKPPPADARLCAFNAGIQFVWGAVLAVSLQQRSIALGGRHAVETYAAIAAAGALVATVVQLVVGRWSDRRVARGGRRDAFYRAGVAVSVPALVWLYIAPTQTALAAAFLTLEVGMNVAIGPYQAIIPDYVPQRRRGRASSWMSAYQSAGNAAGLLVAGFVTDLRAVALVLAAGLAGSYAVTARAIAGRPGGLTAQDAPRASRVTLAALLISRGCVNVGFFTVLGFLLFYVRTSFGPPAGNVQTQTALLFLAFTLAAIPGAVAAARPADRVDKRWVVTVALATFCAALLGLAAAPSLAVAYGLAVAAGFGWGAFTTADWALATALLPAGTMATAMGVWNVATTLPQVLAPLLAAPLVLRFDALRPGLGPRGAMVLAASELALGCLALWRVPRT